MWVFVATGAAVFIDSDEYSFGKRGLRFGRRMAFDAINGGVFAAQRIG